MQPDHDGSAEWNIFWDSVSAKKLLHLDIPIVLFPLDVTKQVPVDERLLYKLNRHSQNKVTKLVTKIYTHAFDLSNYYMWHTLTALHIGHDDFAFLQKAKVNIEHRGTSQGNIYKSEIGVEIEYAFDIDEREFLYYFFNQMKDY
jgi:purine nucleosidase